MVSHPQLLQQRGHLLILNFGAAVASAEHTIMIYITESNDSLLDCPTLSYHLII